MAEPRALTNVYKYDLNIPSCALQLELQTSSNGFRGYEVTVSSYIQTAEHQSVLSALLQHSSEPLIR